MSDRMPEPANSTADRVAEAARHYGSFFWSFVRDSRTVGAVAPTSRGVSRRITELAGIASAQRVVELGAGTGVITRDLLEALPADGHLWAYEIHEPFVETLRATFDDPRFTVIDEPAERLAELREREAPEGFDAIVSTLPFSLVGPRGTREIVHTIHESLRPGGTLVALQYHPRFLPPFLRVEFGRIEREVYPWNIPPATLLRVRRAS